MLITALPKRAVRKASHALGLAAEGIPESG